MQKAENSLDNLEEKCGTVARKSTRADEQEQPRDRLAYAALNSQQGHRCEAVRRARPSERMPG